MLMSKIALITGATSGIGKACAEIYAQNGFNLIITGRRLERLTAFKNQLESDYAIKVQTLCFDVRNRNEVENNLQSLPDDWKKIDLLINNAGLSRGFDPIQSGNLDDWESMIDTNIKGLLYVSKIVSNWMIPFKSGHIVNIGSIAGKEVYPNGNVYCASKYAVDALTKSMRIDLLPKGIRVSSICPGMVETEFSLVRFKGDAERAANVYKGLQPLLAEDIAESIRYIIESPFRITIADLIIFPNAQASSRDFIRKDA